MNLIKKIIRRFHNNKMNNKMNFKMNFRINNQNNNQMQKNKNLIIKWKQNKTINMKIMKLLAKIIKNQISN